VVEAVAFQAALELFDGVATIEGGLDEAHSLFACLGLSVQALRSPLALLHPEGEDLPDGVRSWRRVLSVELQALLLWGALSGLEAPCLALMIGLDLEIYRGLESGSLLLSGSELSLEIFGLLSCASLGVVLSWALNTRFPLGG